MLTTLGILILSYLKQHFTPGQEPGAKLSWSWRYFDVWNNKLSAIFSISFHPLLVINYDKTTVANTISNDSKKIIQRTWTLRLHSGGSTNQLLCKIESIQGVQITVKNSGITIWGDDFPLPCREAAFRAIANSARGASRASHRWSGARPPNVFGAFWGENQVSGNYGLE